MRTRLTRTDLMPLIPLGVEAVSEAVYSRAGDGDVYPLLRWAAHQLHANPCDALDALARLIRWDGAEREFGSPARRAMADELACSGLVVDTVGAISRDPQITGGDRSLGIVSHVSRDIETRVLEKITGVEMITNSNAWNKGNLWDPTLGTTVAGWARGLTKAMTESIVRRARNAHETPISAWDDDESGDNLLLSTVPSDGRPSLLDMHPDLVFPRPLGLDRRRFLVEGAGPSDLISAGWWHPSLNALDDPRQALTFLLAPLHDDPGIPRILSSAGVSMIVTEHYAKDQSTYGTADGGLLVHELSGEANRLNITLHTLMERLGTLAARCL